MALLEHSEENGRLEPIKLKVQEDEVIDQRWVAKNIGKLRTSA
jgi:hypothetical protein